MWYVHVSSSLQSFFLALKPVLMYFQRENIFLWGAGYSEFEMNQPLNSLSIAQARNFSREVAPLFFLKQWKCSAEVLVYSPMPAKSPALQVATSGLAEASRPVSNQKSKEFKSYQVEFFFSVNQTKPKFQQFQLEWVIFDKLKR